MELQSDYYTTLEVADMFGVTTSTVSEWIRKGKVAAIKTPGGKWRISRKEVLRHLERP